MLSQEDRDRLEATYLRLKDEIAQMYAHGKLVAIANERVVGEAATFREMDAILRAQGLDPRMVMVVEAGVDYSSYLTFL